MSAIDSSADVSSLFFSACSLLNLIQSTTLDSMLGVDKVKAVHCV